MHKFAAISIVMLLASAYCVEGAPKFRIQVVDNSSDPVGQRLVYQLKEKIRGSHSMELISNCDKGCWRIIVYTLDKEPDDSALKGHATVFSVIWLGVPESQPQTQLFLHSTIGYTGRERVMDSAENIIAETDRLFSRMTPPTG